MPIRGYSRPTKRGGLSAAGRADKRAIEGRKSLELLKMEVRDAAQRGKGWRSGKAR